jgi:hypothetical protein
MLLPSPAMPGKGEFRLKKAARAGYTVDSPGALTLPHSPSLSHTINLFRFALITTAQGVCIIFFPISFTL